MNLDPLFIGIENTINSIALFFLVLKYLILESDNPLDYLKYAFGIMLIVCLYMRNRGGDSFLNEEIYVGSKKSTK